MSSEIDIKAEVARVQQEMTTLANQLALVNQQIDNLRTQKDSISSNILKRMGQLELLQRLDGAKE